MMTCHFFPGVLRMVFMTYVLRLRMKMYIHALFFKRCQPSVSVNIWPFVAFILYRHRLNILSIFPIFIKYR